MLFTYFIFYDQILIPQSDYLQNHYFVSTIEAKIKVMIEQSINAAFPIQLKLAIQSYLHNYHRMSLIKGFIEQLDFFAHPQFMYYKKEPGYRTLTGGIVSIALIIVFASIFASLAIDTFANNIIIDSTSISYDTDPSLYSLIADPANSFMFAIGLSGIDLSSSQRYFDIQLDVISVVNNAKSTTKVNLQPCKIDQWSGISDQITSTYTSLNFQQWLCPPKGYEFPIQGKKTSPTFKYAKITVSKCGSSLNASTCLNSSTVNAFIDSNQGATLNLYYVNPILNTADKEYIDYYLQDSNYFSFNTNMGTSANLYYSQYEITTDHSILPWQSPSTDTGAMTVAPANSQIYSVINTNQYAKIYLRKSSQRFNITRSFQKLDETLSYIGGLLGTVVLMLAFFNVYDKFCYQIEFGDRIFKQNNNGNFGSENFNFIVFLGYGFFNILTIFGIVLNWKSMKKYHQCRTECIKQLDMTLLFKKIEFFEEVSKVVLEDHHIKGLHMLPKKRIRDAKKTRKRYMLQSLIYHNLDKKACEVYVQDTQYKRRHEQFLKEKKQTIVSQIIKQEQQQDEDIKNLRNECRQSYKRLADESERGETFSKKIVSKLGTKEICEAILNLNMNIENNAAVSEMNPNASLPSLGQMMRNYQPPVNSFPSLQIMLSPTIDNGKRQGRPSNS